LLVHSIRRRGTRGDVGNRAARKVGTPERRDESCGPAVDERKEVRTLDGVNVSDGARGKVDGPKVESQPAAGREYTVPSTISVPPARRAALTNPPAGVSNAPPGAGCINSSNRPRLTTRSPGTRARLVERRSDTGPASALAAESVPYDTI
jgi:hypothetical protein